MSRMKPNIRREDHAPSIRCAYCPATFQPKPQRQARAGKLWDSTKAEREARAVGWSFPRVARPGGKMRVAEPRCPSHRDGPTQEPT